MSVIAAVLWVIVFFVWLWRGLTLQMNGVRPSAWFAVFILMSLAMVGITVTGCIYEPEIAWNAYIYVNAGLALIMLFFSLLAHKL